ncbi:hypothetical protein MAPG_06125 [Magnaporthiopsis poae ATCC 64411]|uniref:Uncharacterized protein n=1 Tax=Magnaporthiopsis poae (strain ATCC 64411 / 73-15) TaxID=644358 RepID=A0A0C4E174_MAGP6|nr:hypothetical protein MAPG_06125 [Magnaporthiopsis poae ATCC 64411]
MRAEPTGPTIFGYSKSAPTDWWVDGAVLMPPLGWETGPPSTLFPVASHQKTVERRTCTCREWDGRQSTNIAAASVDLQMEADEMIWSPATRANGRLQTWPG